MYRMPSDEDLAALIAMRYGFVSVIEILRDDPTGLSGLQEAREATIVHQRIIYADDDGVIHDVPLDVNLEEGADR
ncbi:hypothetical protein ACFL3C_01865 [Patescibacteria group bacterium]